MARQNKTPAQRAQDAYDIAKRVAERLDKKARKARSALADLDREHREAAARRDFLAQHPDLPKNQPTESGDTA